MPYMLQTITMSTAVPVSIFVTSARISAMTSIAIIGAVVIMVMEVGTMPTGNRIDSQALPYLYKIANNMVTMPRRVVAVVVMTEQTTLIRALKNTIRHWQSAPWS